MENFFYSLMSEQGPIVAALAAVFVIGAGVFLRRVNWFAPDSTGAGPDERVDQLQDTVAGMNDRLKRVENDIEHLPTRSEIQALHVKIVAVEGKVGAIDRTSNASAHSLTRIQDFLYNLAKESK